MAPFSNLLPVGDRAVLVELEGLPEVLSLQAQLHADPDPDQIDVVAAARTVLVTAGSRRGAERIAARIRGFDLSASPEVDDALVEIEVVYDGADLADVASATGLSEQGVVEAHTAQTWTAAFGGFSPGFAYLVGENESLEVARRASPRTSVPAGAVALAGNFSAVYPRESPGGWQLIGRTDAVLWDLARENPALIRPGNRVRFSAVRGSARTVGGAASPRSRPGAAAGPGAAGGLTVTSPGLSSTIQDLGRPGLAAIGVPGAGALDRASFRQANRLVGNSPGAAAVESVFGGLTLEARADHVIAVTGALVPLTISDVDGTERDAELCAPFVLRAGETLQVGFPSKGLRSYTAVRGGVDLGPSLGSRSSDTLSGLGPPPLAAGTLLAVGEAHAGSPVGTAELPREFDTEALLRIVPGPRADWFAEGELQRLCEAPWSVTVQSNRIGVRLDGPPLTRRDRGELASEGVVTGSLQVPPSGLPVLFLADHPVTGGYPVIAVVIAEDLDRVAQLPPGSVVRFSAVPERAPTL